MASDTAPARVIGRYHLYGEIASGGMATVHYGRMVGPAGFSRTVAVKRLHPQYAKEPEFASMLVDEARIAARVRHPNVVATLDIVTEADEMLLVMEYVQGVTLSHLIRELGGQPVPVPIAVGLICGALYGLHAAHEARSEAGEVLGVVHRDVSPQNILVGADGVARVADFGIAKATGRLQTTQDGQLKGKTGYMAPEQIRARPIDRRTDVYAAAVVLWEVLAGRRLFTGDAPAAVWNAVLEAPVPKVSLERADAAALDAAVAKAMARDPEERFRTARALAVALEEAVRPASAREIGEWVEASASATLAMRAQRVARIEASSPASAPATAGAAGEAPAGSAVPVIVLGQGEAREPHTSTSHVSNSPSASARRARAPLLLGAAATVVVIAGAAFFTLRGSAAGGASGAASADTEPSARVPIVVFPAATATPSVPVTLSVAPSSAPATPAATAKSPPRAAPAPRPRLDCSPPYTLDEGGVRHWKKGC